MQTSTWTTLCYERGLQIMSSGDCNMYPNYFVGVEVPVYDIGWLDSLHFVCLVIPLFGIDYYWVSSVSRRYVFGFVVLLRFYCSMGRFLEL